jgi:hypothetical protein
MVSRARRGSASYFLFPIPYSLLTTHYSHPAYGHFTTGGSEERMASTLPPVFSPKTVPRS